MQPYQVKGLVTVLACAAVLAGLALPMVLKKVPRNLVYGYRTRLTLSDDHVWYEANAYFGRGLLLACLASVSGILVLCRLPGLTPRAFIDLTVAVLVAPLAAAVLATWRFTRTLTPRAPDHKYI